MPTPMASGAFASLASLCLSLKSYSTRSQFIHFWFLWLDETVANASGVSTTANIPNKQDKTLVFAVQPIYNFHNRLNVEFVMICHCNLDDRRRFCGCFMLLVTQPVTVIEESNAFII